MILKIIRKFRIFFFYTNHAKCIFKICHPIKEPYPNINLCLYSLFISAMHTYIASLPSIDTINPTTKTRKKYVKCVGCWFACEHVHFFISLSKIIGFRGAFHALGWSVFDFDFTWIKKIGLVNYHHICSPPGGVSLNSFCWTCVHHFSPPKEHDRPHKSVFVFLYRVSSTLFSCHFMSLV